MNKKILIATVFATLMITVPMTSVIGASDTTDDCNCQVLNRNNNIRFEIFITKKEEKHGYGHICIDVNNKKEFLDRCKKYGIEPMIINKDGKNLLFVKDFSGNLFEIKEK